MWQVAGLSGLALKIIAVFILHLRKINGPCENLLFG